MQHLFILFFIQDQCNLKIKTNLAQYLEINCLTLYFLENGCCETLYVKTRIKECSLGQCRQYEYLSTFAEHICEYVRRRKRKINQFFSCLILYFAFEYVFDLNLFSAVTQESNNIVTSLIAHTENTTNLRQCCLQFIAYSNIICIYIAPV